MGFFRLKTEKKGEKFMICLFFAKTRLFRGFLFSLLVLADGNRKSLKNRLFGRNLCQNNRRD